MLVGKYRVLMKSMEAGVSVPEVHGWRYLLLAV